MNDNAASEEAASVDRHKLRWNDKRMGKFAQKRGNTLIVFIGKKSLLFKNHFKSL